MTTRTKVHLILSGLLMIATGILIICNPIDTLETIAWIYGVITIVRGISSIVYYAGGGRSSFGGTGALFRGIVDIILGIVIIFDRYLIAGALPIIFALWLTVFGIERVARAIDLKKMGYRPWTAIFAIGLISGVVGIISLFSPIMSAGIMAVLLGVGFILQGIGYFLLIIDVKKLQKKYDLFDKDEYIVD